MVKEKLIPLSVNWLHKHPIRQYGYMKEQIQKMGGDTFLEYICESLVVDFLKGMSKLPGGSLSRLAWAEGGYITWGTLLLGVQKGLFCAFTVSGQPVCTDTGRTLT